MAPFAVLALVLLVVLAPWPAPTVTVSKPPSLEAGRAWQATLRVRRGGRPVTGARPFVLIAKGAVKRSFQARPAGRGLYRARGGVSRLPG